MIASTKVGRGPAGPSTGGGGVAIGRGGTIAFGGSTTLASMKRDPQSLVDYLYRETSFPNGCVLLTGTGIVPPDEFTLQAGDDIAITIDGVGTLQNVVA